MLDFCRHGCWVVLPRNKVVSLPNLRILPIGVVPKRYRRPRLIADYTFSSFNTETLQWAPREAMQFGRALQRVFTTLVHADPRYGPAHTSKIVVAEGIYCVWVQLPEVPNFRSCFFPDTSWLCPLGCLSTRLAYGQGQIAAIFHRVD
jgi:hypothetical protein